MDLKRIGIIRKKGSDEARHICEELTSWFTAKKITPIIDSLDEVVDLLVILGGDGTLLHVAEHASRLQIPVIGVNLGGLGFLTEIAVAERHQALQAIIDGVMSIEDRMMLKVRILAAGQTSAWRYALNDVVISKGNVDQLVYLGTWADQEYITTYKADGLIFSTPTGATAYNLSAGGPIVHPAMRSILVTPICPFMLESRPVLMPPTVRLTTKLDGLGNEVKVIVDGQFAWDMRENDVLEVGAAEKSLRLIGSTQKGYFEILRSKLNWGGRSASLPGQAVC